MKGSPAQTRHARDQPRRPSRASGRSSQSLHLSGRLLSGLGSGPRPPTPRPPRPQGSEEQQGPASRRAARPADWLAGERAAGLQRCSPHLKGLNQGKMAASPPGPCRAARGILASRVPALGAWGWRARLTIVPAAVAAAAARTPALWHW